MLEKHLKICADCRKMADQIYGETPGRDLELPAKLTAEEKEDLKQQVLQRIKGMAAERGR